MKARWMPVFCLTILGASWAWPGEAVSSEPLPQPGRKGDFPGIHFIKPGSVLKDIVVPRYEHHRLTAKLNFALMEVLDRSHVLAKELVAVMYDRTGGATRIHTETAVFSFLDDTVRSGVRTTIESERYRAEGSNLTVQTKTHRGFLRGPVFMEMPALGQRHQEKHADSPAPGKSNAPAAPSGEEASVPPASLPLSNPVSRPATTS